VGGGGVDLAWGRRLDAPPRHHSCAPQRPVGADCVCRAARPGSSGHTPAGGVAAPAPHGACGGGSGGGRSQRGATPAPGAPPAPPACRPRSGRHPPTLPRDCWHWRAAGTPQPGACACASTPPVGFLRVWPWCRLVWPCSPPTHPAVRSVGRLGEGPARGRLAVLSVAATPTTVVCRTRAPPAVCATLPPARRTPAAASPEGTSPPERFGVGPPLSVPPHATSAPRLSVARFFQRRRATPLGGVPSVAAPPPRAPPRPAPAPAPACAARVRALPRRVPTEQGHARRRGRRLGSRQLRGVPALAKPVACGAPCGLPTDRPAPRSVSARARHGVVCCLPIARWPAAAAPAACSFHRHGAGWQGLTVGRGWRRLLVGGGSSTRDHLVVLSAHVRCIPRLVTASVGRGPDSAHFVCVRARTGQGDVELGPDVDPTAAPFVAAAC